MHDANSDQHHISENSLSHMIYSDEQDDMEKLSSHLESSYFYRISNAIIRVIRFVDVYRERGD